MRIFTPLLQPSTPDRSIFSGDMIARLKSASLFSFTAALLLLGTGCSSLPSSGPSPSRIKAGSQQANGSNPDSYILVPITGEVVAELNRRPAYSSVPSPLFSAEIPSRASAIGVQAIKPASREVVSSGDVLSVTIYESGGGLFGMVVPNGQATSANTLPLQLVDESGQITVPYAGRVQATGRTLHEIELEIIERLTTKTINPQVIVSLSARKGFHSVTVTGDVKAATQMPIPMSGAKLLDAITAAGGTTGRAHETVVSVMRGTKGRSDYLSAIYDDASKNIPLEPGDTILVRHRPRTYLAFGATGKNGHYPFDKEEISLAEAIARSGGLIDSRANPSTIFLYRMDDSSPRGSKPAAPTIYQLDLRSPDGFFLAQNFPIRDRDILYFPNAGSVGVMKFMSIINAVTSPARSGLSVASQVDRLDN